MPSRRPIKCTKDRKELLLAVRRNSVVSQKHKVHRLGGNCRDLSTDNSSANIQNTRRRCRTSSQTPSTEQRNIKGWQMDIKNRRISKHLDRRETQVCTINCDFKQRRIDRITIQSYYRRIVFLAVWRQP